MLQNHTEIFTLCEQFPNMFFFLALNQIFWASFQFEYEFYKFQRALQIRTLLLAHSGPVKARAGVVMPSS
jgi:hypothetical protein